MDLATGLVAAALVVPCRSFTLRALPRIAADDLAAFEEYFDRGDPVIVQGASICPGSFSLEAWRQLCHPTKVVGVRRPRRAADRDAMWAGMIPLGTTRLGDFFESMLAANRTKSRARTYAFGMDLLDHCPWAFESLSIPAALVGRMGAQLKHEGECRPPEERNLGLFLTLGRGLKTDLHLDDKHEAFFASMCSGTKRWRILSNRDFAAHAEAFRPFLDADMEGTRTSSGSFVFADVVRPLETWAKTSPLTDIDVTVYEGDLEPGDLLFVPPGAPHAGHTLTKTSAMVAWNDLTLPGAREAEEACQVGGWFCSSDQWHKMRDDIGRMRAGVARQSRRQQDTPAIEAFGCRGGAQLCEEGLLRDPEVEAAFCSRRGGHEL